MDDIDRIVDEILKSDRLRESVTFSSRSYGSQPIIQTGKQYRETYRNREQAAPGNGRKRPGEAPRHASPNPRYARPAPAPRPASAPIPASAPRPSYPSQPATTDRPPTAPPRVAPQARTEQPAHVPRRYYELQELARSQGQVGPSSLQGMLAYGTRSASRLFYEQARFMEDFEDDYRFEGTFFQYYPTYSSMSLTQLRGYFSWRTRVRRGTVDDAPTSFAFLYVYELLCGIGTTPGEQGYRQLKDFREAYLAATSGTTSSFGTYTRVWLRDYAVYHGLDASLARGVADGLLKAVHTLLLTERAALRGAALERRLESRHPLVGETPSDEQLFEALDACARYHIGGSRLRKDHLDDLRVVCCDVFRALCVHCGRRRKTDYVEGLFGTPIDDFHAMFASAVFYDPQPHEDVTYQVSSVESFVCKDGKWRHHLICDLPSPSRELGEVLRATDQRLRAALDYPYPLKERPVQAYVKKIIDQAIEQLLERRREEERRRITIDLTRLAGIRAAAATTQEALLTDEEREEAPAVAPALVPEHGAGLSSAPVNSSTATAKGGGAHAHSHALSSLPGLHDARGQTPEGASNSAAESAGQAAGGAGQSLATASSAAAGDAALAPAEERVLHALLKGEEVSGALEPGDPLLSLIIDAINDKLFDIVGDAVIEYDDDAPSLIEDYRSDVQEVLGL